MVVHSLRVSFFNIPSCDHNNFSLLLFDLLLFTFSWVTVVQNLNFLCIPSGDHKFSFIIIISFIIQQVLFICFLAPESNAPVSTFRHIFHGFPISLSSLCYSSFRLTSHFSFPPPSRSPFLYLFTRTLFPLFISSSLLSFLFLSPLFLLSPFTLFLFFHYFSLSSPPPFSLLPFSSFTSPFHYLTLCHPFCFFTSFHLLSFLSASHLFIPFFPWLSLFSPFQYPFLFSIFLFHPAPPHYPPSQPIPFPS